MPRSNERKAGTVAFLKATTLWACIPLVLVLGYHILFVDPEALPFSLWRFLHLLLASFALFLTFASFAGGVATCRDLRLAGVAVHGGLVSLFVLGLAGYAAPIAERRAFITSGGNVESWFPTGPATLNGLLALRREVLQVPEGEHTLAGDADHLPPNWVTFLLHSDLALALFAILAALLGNRIGLLTSGIPPPTRWNARWSLGLATAVLYFIAAAVGGEWVRRASEHSGVLGAWLPLSVPFCELLLLQILFVRKRRRLHASSQSVVK